jgi:hypothetical protein
VTAGDVSITITYDDDAMRGSVAVHSPSATRDIRVKATPHNGTMIFLYEGPSASDHPPAGEHLKPGAIVARVVSVLETDRLYFDGDYAPPATLPADGFFVCRRD